MNYFRNIFNKKPNPDAVVNANDMFERGVNPEKAIIDNLIIKYRIPDKNKVSFEKDLRTEYNRLRQIKENDTQMYQKERETAQDEDALREIIKRNKIPTPTNLHKYRGGGMKKHRKTASKRRKSNKTRKQLNKRK